MKTIKWLWEWGLIIWIWLILYAVHCSMACYIQAPFEGRVQ